MKASINFNISTNARAFIHTTHTKAKLQAQTHTHTHTHTCNYMPKNMKAGITHSGTDTTNN